jgi:hypothetical protein
MQLHAVVHRNNTAIDYADVIVDNFDEMLLRSHEAPLVCVISLHSFYRPALSISEIAPGVAAHSFSL